jgi:hypothetical protein
MLGGASETHQVLSKTPRVQALVFLETYADAFPIKASDDPGLIAWCLESKIPSAAKCGYPCRGLALATSPRSKRSSINLK